VSFHVPERYRMVDGPMASRESDGNNGAFVLPSPVSDRMLVMIASDGLDWEHVSVRAIQGRRDRTPVWDEMCHIKALCWDDEDVVMQLHPRKSEYVNNHSHVLHLWRPTVATIPEPHSLLVGYKELGTIRE
jgi:hypothetical protein